MRPLDTAREAQDVQIEVFRRMTVGRKLELACELCDLGRERILGALVARNPALSPDGARRAMLREVLGEVAFAAAFDGEGRQVA